MAVLRRNQKILAFAIVLVGAVGALLIVAWPQIQDWVKPAKESPPGPTEFVAAVNDEKILRSAYEARLNAQKFYYTNVSPLPEEELAQLGGWVLEELIQEKLLTRLLAQQGITVSDEEARQRIEEVSVKERFKGDWAKYEEELKASYETTLDEVMRTVRLDMLEEKTAQLKTTKHIFAIWVEKKEPQFVSYDVMKAEERTRLEKVNQLKKEKAEALLQKIQNGEDIALLARESSEHQESAGQGGDLGFLFLPTEAGSAPQPKFVSFPGAAAVMQALQVLGVGENKMYEIFTGYAVIKVTEVREGPRGVQSFDDWYQDFRARANIVMF